MNKLKVCLAALALAGGQAMAGTVIYSNYSDDPASASYPYQDPIYGFGVQWQASAGGGFGDHPYGSSYAMPFTVPAGQDQPLESVSVAMYKNPDGAPANLTIRLVKDNGGGLPSSNPADIVETLAVDPTIVEDTTSFLDMATPDHPLLLAGQTYWVTAEVSRYDTATPGDDALYYWIQNKESAQFYDTINQFNYSFNGGAGAWQGYFSQSFTVDAPTLRVTAVSAVPTPSAAAAGLVGLAGLAVRSWGQRRRRQG